VTNAASGPPLVTVCIPTFNGEPLLREVLDAVFAQRTDFPFDVLVIDSGSTDTTLDIVRRTPARLHEIPNKEFGHGRTRNLAFELAAGTVAAFLTQDATPASEEWLAHLVAPLVVDPSVGASYGPHIPRPDADPKTRRDQTEFFAGMGPPDRPTIHRLGDIVFFSDVNSCIRKETWRRIPFRDLPYAEDQAFGKDLLESGGAKAYTPQAAVVHSHSFPPAQYFRRMFDEWMGVKIAIGASFTPKLSTALRLAVSAIANDRRYIWSLQAPLARRAGWMWRAVLMDLAREFTAYLVEHEDRIPDGVKDRLSFERNLKRKLRKNAIG
jgi:glycosyltransferase involved in cell wall biosynthesis